MSQEDFPRLPASERKAITIETVIQLASEQNPAEITTAAIAARMGLTQGALFRHFPTKNALLGSVMEWVAGRLLARVEAEMRGHESALDALQSAFLAHVRFVAEHPGVPRILFSELQRAEETPAKQMVKSLIRQYSQRLSGTVERGKSAGEITPDLQTDAITMMFIGTIQGLVMRSMLTGGVGKIRAEAPAAWAILRRGIEART